jgi:hypothetical protein
MSDMAEFTDQEKSTMRNAAYGAVFLVSNADPGMFDVIKEGFAASKSFAHASGDLQGVFKGFSMPKMPSGNPADMESAILGELSQSLSTLQAKSPEDVEPYRNLVLDACTSAAEAAGGGVSSKESTALSKIKTALGADTSSQ